MKKEITVLVINLKDYSYPFPVSANNAIVAKFFSTLMNLEIDFARDCELEKKEYDNYWHVYKINKNDFNFLRLATDFRFGKHKKNTYIVS